MYNELLKITQKEFLPEHLRKEASLMLDMYGAGHFNTAFNKECLNLIRLCTQIEQAK